MSRQQQPAAEQSAADSYAYARYWLLHELTRLRSVIAVGSASASSVLRERRYLQGKLNTLRIAKYGARPELPKVAKVRKKRAPVAAPAIPVSGKGAILLAMLKQPEGTTIDAVCAATGWQRKSASARICVLGKTVKITRNGKVYRAI